MAEISAEQYRRDQDALYNAQQRAWNILSEGGLPTPEPMQGEGPMAYRKRLATILSANTPHKDTNVRAIQDERVFEITERAIYADAEKNARNPLDLKPGELREIKKIDRTGRTISEFIGDPSAWMNPFKSEAQLQVKINTARDMKDADAKRPQF